MENKLKNLILPLLLSLIISSNLMSEDIKIGFVNTDRVIREADPAIEALKKLEKEFADREEEIKKIRSNIKKLQEKFEKDNLTLSDSQKRNMEQKILKNSSLLEVRLIISGLFIM